MKRSLPRILVLSAFLGGIALSGIGGILNVPAQGFSGQAGAVPQAQQPATPSSTASPSPTSTLSPASTEAFVAPAARGTEVFSASVYAFIQAPSGPVQSPYVTVSGFQARTFAPTTQIVGTLNTADFTCPGSPCTLPLQAGESRIAFRAILADGQASATVFARVFVSQEADGYHVIIQSVSQFFGSFSDACLKIWEVPDDTKGPWAEFPPFPYQLNTRVTLHQLAARLIVNGLVDTRDCPAGGMSGDLSWPNGCGLERARDKMIEWQNLYDEAIWSAAAEVGIPPKILKTLIQIESQFWPGNERYYVDEYGLGQINELGVDVLLRRDPTLYQQACTGVLTNCTTPYISLSPVEQSMVRGALLKSQDAVCPTCANGVDLTKARQSITFIAQVLRANCLQVHSILTARSAVSDYESLWKFTLLAYHSGLQCLEMAVKAVKKADQPVDWAHVADQTLCGTGRKYVTGFWGTLNQFDNYLFTAGPSPLVQFSPVFATRTPIPSPTPILSSAQVVVAVYLDANSNGTPEPTEALNGIPVQLVFPDGRVLGGITQQGQARFDLSGERMGLEVIARLPGLYREYRFFLPQQGTVPVVFIFTQPILPRTLP
jgi:predicted secreted protein